MAPGPGEVTGAGVSPTRSGRTSGNARGAATGGARRTLPTHDPGAASTFGLSADGVSATGLAARVRHFATCSRRGAAVTRSSRAVGDPPGGTGLGAARLAATGLGAEGPGACDLAWGAPSLVPDVWVAASPGAAAVHLNSGRATGARTALLTSARRTGEVVGSRTS